MSAPDAVTTVHATGPVTLKAYPPSHDWFERGFFFALGVICASCLVLAVVGFVTRLVKWLAA